RKSIRRQVNSEGEQVNLSRRSVCVERASERAIECEFPSFFPTSTSLPCKRHISATFWSDSAPERKILEKRGRPASDRVALSSLLVQCGGQGWTSPLEKDADPASNGTMTGPYCVSTRSLSKRAHPTRRWPSPGFWAS